MRNFLFLLFFMATTHTSFSQKNEIAFRIQEKDLIPEGITYDAATKTFFVSSIAKKKIVKINANKVVSDFVTSGRDGLGEALGMKVFNGSLWACSNWDEGDVDNSMVHQFDIATGKLIKKWTLTTKGEKHLLNDLIVLNDKEAIATDSDTGNLYKVDGSSSEPTLFIQDNQLRYINGITTTPDGKFVIVNALVGFLKVNIESKEITPLSFKAYYSIGIDGLYWYKQSLVGIQNVSYPATVNLYSLNEAGDKVNGGKVLATDLPEWDIPTTGVIVGDWFYYIANSQLLNYDKGAIKDPSQLKEVLIMRVSLK
jgi:hypothetical protein